jgi:hypothetical protein
MERLIIRDERGQLVPMTFSDSQNILWKYTAPSLDERDRIWQIVVKPRQVYSSTFYANLIFTRTLEQANTNSLIIAHDLDTTAALLEKAKTFYEHLPLPKLHPGKLKELIFPLSGGESKLRIMSAGIASKGRGTTQTCLLCSEVAHWEHPEVMTGLFQAIPDLSDTIWVIESTANGLGGKGAMFHKLWVDAVAGRNKFDPIFIPWFIMPKYRAAPAVDPSEWDEEETILSETFGDLGLTGESLRWRRDTIATKCQGSVEMFHQEYPASPDEAFISSGLPAFDPLALTKQRKYIGPPKLRLTYMESSDKLLRDSRGELHVWKEPVNGHSYAVGVDCAEGIRDMDGKPLGDYSCAQIIDMDDLEQVAVLHGSIGPWEFSKFLARAAKWYNTAIVNIEIASAGIAVQDYMLRVLNYPRFHPWRGKPDSVPRMGHTTRLYGWSTNVYSRPLLIESGRRALNTALLTLHDESTLAEIRNFSRADNGKYQAEVGHDDRVLALLLALRTREENHSPIKAKVISDPSLSEPDYRGVRVIEAHEPEKLGMRRIHKLLNKRVDRAVKSWMEL